MWLQQPDVPAQLGAKYALSTDFFVACCNEIAVIFLT